MRMKWMLACCLCITLYALHSCDKNNDGFLPQGGQLPTNYISIRDTAVLPNLLIIANGNSVTFLNQTNTTRTIVSDDDVTIRTGAILPDSFYFYKKDTTGTFDFHCVEDPLLRGTIIQTP